MIQLDQERVPKIPEEKKKQRDRETNETKGRRGESTGRRRKINPGRGRLRPTSGMMSFRGKNNYAGPPPARASIHAVWGGKG